MKVMNTGHMCKLLKLELKPINITIIGIGQIKTNIKYFVNVSIIITTTISVKKKTSR